MFAVFVMVIVKTLARFICIELSPTSERTVSASLNEENAGITLDAAIP
ncbi:MAG: hypothetical protein JSS98_14025 [Bacteroidetes bacterium]|nr:hypothetical protein [Bacteroidota bacterium]